MKAQWEIRMSKSRGVPYYFNVGTEQSVWEQPAELSQDELSKLPGAQYLKAAPAQSSGGGGGKPGQVRASHLLVKHRDSRRPSSWKEVRRRTPSLCEIVADWVNSRSSVE